MTFSELRKKDVICIADGRLLGRASDLVIDADRGQILAIIIPACGGSLFHGEKTRTTIPWPQIACIGDDVILVSQTPCRT